jgi:hypothetical protein
LWPFHENLIPFYEQGNQPIEIAIWWRMSSVRTKGEREVRHAEAGSDTDGIAATDCAVFAGD